MKHTNKEIWDTLSAVDVSEYQEEKMGSVSYTHLTLPTILLV